MWPKLTGTQTIKGITYTPDGEDVIADGTATDWAVLKQTIHLADGDYLISGNSKRIQIGANGTYLHPADNPQHITAGDYDCEISLPAGTVCNKQRFTPRLYRI
ncbi:hypothetical protein [Bifidobacterium aerophilum]|uniref:Uncharacterized protein n=1 Tax=Bifidobacterium aerophilum TaxID=1798155 RepID=A0A6N9Z7J0_9BIFI|nr:hypothetical protein [Bifidobacterium aerophilum]NEG90612.1 hypothetical protein [Bifidobacterium aerophilum]